ncbi:ATPase, partial [Pseudomonas aeruginosa]
NSAEWSAFTQASSKTQRPTLVQALRSVRDGGLSTAVTPSHEMRRYLRTLVTVIQVERNSGNPWKGPGQARGFRDRLITWKEGLTDDATFSAPEGKALGELIQHITVLLSTHQGEWPAIFSRDEVGALLGKM